MAAGGELSAPSAREWDADRVPALDTPVPTLLLSHGAAPVDGPLRLGGILSGLPAQLRALLRSS